jgi:DNA-binding response OmpR family regulator
MGVLIVEHEGLIRMLVHDLLGEAGFECRDFGDADETIAVFDGSDCQPVRCERGRTRNPTGPE